MRRTGTSDWGHASRLYRGLYATVRGPLASVSRVGVRGFGVYEALGDRGAIVAANHASAWDPVAINASAPRPISWIAKREAFRPGIAAWFVRGIGSIPVDRQKRGNAAAFAEALAAIERQNRIVGVFPEGTRGPPDAVRPAHTGVARLALLSGAPVVPVGVLCDQFLAKGRVVPSFGQRAWVRVGEAITVARDPAAAEDRATTQKLAEDVMARVRTLLAECLDARGRDEAWTRP